jgi:hypothetical protein
MARLSQTSSGDAAGFDAAFDLTSSVALSALAALSPVAANAFPRPVLKALPDFAMPQNNVCKQRWLRRQKRVGRSE